MKNDNKRLTAARLLQGFHPTPRYAPLIGAAAVAGLLMLAPAPASAASVAPVASFGANPGNLQMFKYVPDNLPANAPLVVAMHGCTQNASNYDQEPGWTKIADQMGFAVVFPQQPSANNANTCFNWFESGDINRGQGEARSIISMVDHMIATHGVNSSRVYVTGLSAGGAMTSVMLGSYPDRFAGGGIVAGIPYKCATSMIQGFTCMSGAEKTPQQWGDLVRGGYSGYNGPWPKVSIWHGSSDYTVQIKNANESMEQWTNVHGISQTPTRTETVKGHERKVYEKNGEPVVEWYTISGMGHGTPIDPGTGADQCGSAISYVLDVNICSSYYMARFWGLDAGNPPVDPDDLTPPTVNLTAPAHGATVSGSVTLSASAADDVGVTKVEFYVDGVLVGSVTSAPYALQWDSTSVANGTHAISARAYDAGNNTATDADTSVTVDNGSSGGGWNGCGADTNANHAAAGRATAFGTIYYAKGSWNYMGMGAATVTTLRETSAGSFNVVSACP